MTPIFNQTCPVCGRKLRVAVTLLGHEIACQHCRGHFVACDEVESLARNLAAPTLLARVDQVLAASMERSRAMEELHCGPNSRSDGWGAAVQ